MILSELTSPLTPAEENLVTHFAEKLKQRQGRKKAVSLAKMQTAIIPLTELQVLKMIHYIRVKGLVPHLVHDAEGNYWVAQTREEVESCMKEIRAIEDMMWNERNSLKQQLEISWLK